MLQECCTNAEAKAAGAPVPLTEPAQDAQIMQDVPYMVLSVGKRNTHIAYYTIVCITIFFSASRQLRAATSTSSRDCLENVKEKQASIYDGVSIFIVLNTYKWYTITVCSTTPATNILYSDITRCAFLSPGVVAVSVLWKLYTLHCTITP